MAMHESNLPLRVYGVDFSGAVNAGRTIWLAGGDVKGNVLQCTLCQPTAGLPNSGKARATALTALCAFILEQTPCAVGCDFPFSLPQEHVTEPSWEEFAHKFAGNHPNADAFKRWCLERAEGRELRRATDVEARTPFAAYNLRLYRQTYFGILDLLAPLMAAGQVRVLPMQEPDPGRTWLLEICPASTLKRAGLYAPYKRADAAPVREGLLMSLTDDGRVVVSDEVRDAVIRDRKGDALDSVIAAITTWRVLPEASQPRADNGLLAAIEGRVFV